MDEKIEKTYVNFLQRYPEKYKLADLKRISFGASPRGSINLANAAKCALSSAVGIIPEDVSCSCAWYYAPYRVCEAEAENITSVDIINKIVNEVEVQKLVFSFSHSV
jgi:MoxR-like ATPase